MTRLRLRDECLVLPSENVLHVVHDRGTSELRGAHVHQLHKRLGAYLRGSHTEAEVIEAVPPASRRAVRAYLSRLRDVGALDPEPAALAARDRYEAAVERVSLSGALTTVAGTGRTTCVAIGRYDEAVMRSNIEGVWFLPPSDVPRALLSFERHVRPDGRWMYVVTTSADDQDDDGAHARQLEPYARWLLRTMSRAWSGAYGLRVYRLNFDGGALELLADLGRGAARATPRRLPDEVTLVRPASGDQLPLVSAAAEHALFPGQTVRCVGLTYAAARACALRTFVARETIGPRGPGIRTVRRGRLSASLPDYAVASASDLPVAAGLVVAPSWLELRTRLLEEVAYAEVKAGTDSHCREIDLLASEFDHPAVTQLQAALRLRHPRMSAQLLKTRSGLYVCSTGRLTEYSFVRAKAVADVLVRATWCAYYEASGLPSGPMPDLALTHLSFVTSSALRDLLRRRMRALVGERRQTHTPPQRPPDDVVVGSVQCWGVTAWLGGFAGARNHGISL